MADSGLEATLERWREAARRWHCYVSERVARARREIMETRDIPAHEDWYYRQCLGPVECFGGFAPSGGGVFIA